MNLNTNNHTKLFVNTQLSNTERPSEQHADLDTYSTEDLVKALVADQRAAVAAVQAAAESIARAVDAAVPRIQEGGRIVYVGAGTSGRLGLLDSVELFPTFSWPQERAVSILAGGDQAVYRAVEGAEDSASEGAADVLAKQVGPLDVVLLIAASGSTPYVLGALEQARSLGALTIGIANNPNSAVAGSAHLGITLDTGSEVVSGSTRLKAGTAQKIVLNAFSTSLMVRLNKVYGNLMVDVKPTNAKLMRRCISLTVLATGSSDEQATQALIDCKYHVKTAVLMLKRNLTATQAKNVLKQHQGSLRAAINDHL
jgi:N-acetylmuramic acid 6-phosphate etherase